MPTWKSGSASTHLFYLFCFYAGLVVLTAVSLGRITHDDREGPGLNPFARLPDGRLGTSDFAVATIGFAIMAAAVWLVSQVVR
ncbi:MAG: hypothetical protein PS018_05080 [bacterium]|nr:hypothetical protein [bacterium]